MSLLHTTDANNNVQYLEPFLNISRTICYPESSSFQKKCDIVKKSLRSNLLYWSLKRSVKGELIKAKYPMEKVRDLIPKILDQHGYKVQLQNEIFRLHEEATSNHSPRNNNCTEDGCPIPDMPVIEENLEVVQKARQTWAEFLKEQLLAISSQFNTPLKQPGPVIPKSDEYPRYTGVFGPSNIFEVCVRIQNPNHERTHLSRIAGWGLVKLELKTKSFPQIRKQFEELHPENRQIGIDDEENEWYSKESIGISKKLISNGYIPSITKYMKTGVPLSSRPKIWKQVLEISSHPFKDSKHWENLVDQTNLYQLLVDEMVFNDVKRTCDDDNYFVFEDYLLVLMKSFVRDTWVHDHCALKNIPLIGVSKDGHAKFQYPPNGVVPFEGISLFAAPICFLYSDVEDTYFIFRNLYCKYFCKLHVISSDPEGIISLCKMFEDLLQEKDPQLFYHLLQMKIHPLSIAFNWIFHAFAGYLQVEQLLLLWDRIIGFSSLTLLPILAAGIFWFRSKFLMKATSQQEIYVW